MKNKLNILLLEDDDHDAKLIAHELGEGGLICHLNRVITQESFLRALKQDPPDIILSDHGLPSFNGFEAMALARKERPDTPFIFVTGLNGQEKEIETFERGGIDYVLKSRLSRLVPVVRRALHQEADRAGSRKREQGLKVSEERFSVLIDAVKDYSICMLDQDGRIVSWNSGAERITGYQAQEIAGRYFSCLYEANAIACDLPNRVLAQAVAKGRFEVEGFLTRKGGTQFSASILVTAIRNPQGELTGFALVVRDITDQRRAEAEREKLIKELQAELKGVKKFD